jgi:hypothetical protein
VPPQPPSGRWHVREARRGRVRRRAGGGGVRGGEGGEALLKRRDGSVRRRGAVDFPQSGCAPVTPFADHPVRCPCSVSDGMLPSRGGGWEARRGAMQHVYLLHSQHATGRADGEEGQDEQNLFSEKSSGNSFNICPIIRPQPIYGWRI